MCGRYTLKTPASKVVEKFVVPNLAEFSPRYNIAPTQTSLVVRYDETSVSRKPSMLRWGLIPHWAKEERHGPPLINARSETAAQKPSFRDSLAHKRCLVIADGFYEWTRKSGKHIPHYFQMNDHESFAMAGLWDIWLSPNQNHSPIETFTILTTTANALLETYHDRMPVILDPSDQEMWLDPYLVKPDLLSPLMKPYPSRKMKSKPVSFHVNDIHHEDASCLAPPEIFENKSSSENQLDLDL
jgi:putative SOS response-associated peptidase YedK